MVLMLSNRPRIIVIGNSHLTAVDAKHLVPQADKTMLKAFTIDEAAYCSEHLPFLPCRLHCDIYIKFGILKINKTKLKEILKYHFFFFFFLRLLTNFLGAVLPYSSGFEGLGVTLKKFFFNLLGLKIGVVGGGILDIRICLH